MRSATREQVKSLGAKFVDTGVSAEGSRRLRARAHRGGEGASSRRCSTSRIAAADAVVTTASVPGRPAPKIISRAARRAHAPGLGDRRHRRRAGRQLRAHARRRDRRAPGREDHRRAQSARRARLQRERDVRAQPLQLPEARAQQGRARDRLERRGLRAVVPDARRARSNTSRRAKALEGST